MKKIECIVKRRGHDEDFDEKKVYASCYAACLSTGMNKIKAEKICYKVSKEIKQVIKEKVCVNSNVLFSEIGEAIEKYNKDAAFMYKTHRDIS
jgi:transcriptional regulator NrdR family protein